MIARAVVFLFECYLLIIDFRMFPGPLLQLFLLALFLALSHDEFVSAYTLDDQIKVQQDQVDEQYHKNRVYPT